MRLLIGDLLERGLAATPDAVAATLGSRRISFRELDVAATRTAARLRAQGVRPGDRVAWVAPPSLRALDVFLGCARVGAVLAPVNPKLSPTELEAVLAVVRPALVLVDATCLEVVLATGADRAGVRTVGARETSAWPDLDRLPASTTGGPGVLDESAPHIAYLTSGSTGFPKAALVSHRASWLRAAPGGGTFTATLRGDGGVVCTFPLYHYGGWHYVMEAWQNATAVHLVARADAECVIDAVTRWRATALYCIPAVWERVLDPAFDGADLSSLRYADTGTSPVAGDLVARIKSRLPGTTTTILYGSTEAGRMAALHDWELAERSGSVGRAAFPGSLTIAADGEVCVRTPALMDGYLGAPETTARVMSADGAYRTGDLGRLDDEGYLYLTGRTREVIRSGGEFVAPSEVEHVLALAPGVADVAVVGVPDDRWGEVVCAVVVPAESGPPSLGDLQEFARERLASHKLPRRLALVTGIPRTPATGQVQRSRLREDVLSHVAVRADG